MAIVLRLFVVAAVFVLWASATEIENPGFFLKVSKNVPRIGRRSDGQTGYMGFRTPPHRRSQMNWPNKENSWIRRIRNDVTPQAAYNYVQPFDMQFLFNLLANDSDFDEANFKFISWEDFDKAIESDTQLLKKLYELGREHRAEQFHDMGEPLIQTLGSGPGNSYEHMYYRAERSAEGAAAAAAPAPQTTNH